MGRGRLFTSPRRTGNWIWYVFAAVSADQGFFGLSNECHSSVQMHHLLNNGAEVNQADEKGFTPLHRAAYLAQYDGYLEIYEYLLVSCDALAHVPAHKFLIDIT